MRSPKRQLLSSWLGPWFHTVEGGRVSPWNATSVLVYFGNSSRASREAIRGISGSPLWGGRVCAWHATSVGLLGIGPLGRPFVGSRDPPREEAAFLRGAQLLPQASREAAIRKTNWPACTARRAIHASTLLCLTPAVNANTCLSFAPLRCARLPRVRINISKLQILRSKFSTPNHVLSVWTYFNHYGIDVTVHRCRTR